MLLQSLSGVNIMEVCTPGGDEVARREQYIFATEYNKKPHHILRKLLIAILAIVLLGFLVNVVYNYNLVYIRQQITVANLPDDLEQFSILHLSDLNGRKGMGKRISRVLGSRIYSCVVMTGDMIGRDGDIEGLLEVVEALPKNIPILMIPGDMDPDYLDPMGHAGLTPYADWAEKLIKAGVTILDEPYLMTRGRNDRSRIWFIPEELYSMDLKGLETTYAGVLSRLPEGSLTADQAAQKRVAEYQIARARRIQETVRTIGADDIQVAVAHYPLTESLTETLIGWKETTETFSLRRVSLIMAGHYCAGQWRIPGAGALYVPELGWFPDDELIVGRHYIGRIPQYISPGLGASGSYPYMPFRLFNNPSVSSLELTQKLVQ